MRTKILAIAILAAFLLSGCIHPALTNEPEVEYQDVRISLSTVNPQENLPLFEYDRSQPLEVVEVSTRREGNVTVREIHFASPKGGRVPALVFEPDGEGPFAGLLLMHGDPGSKENFDVLGVLYARYGFVAIAIDAVHIRPDHYIKTPYMAGSWPRYNEQDRLEQTQLMIDLRRAVDYLISRPDVDPERIAYVGGSFGGAMGGLFAGVEDRIRASALLVGDGGILEHLSEPDEQGYPVHWSENIVKALWDIEPIHFVSLAAPTALLFQNGVDDEYVPVSDALRYQQAGSEPKTILWYNAGHFLPQRHNYDHLLWLHQYVGVDTLIWKPSFSPAGILIDRLFLIWYGLTLLAIFYVIWDMRFRMRGSWGALLVWISVLVCLGPIALIGYWLVRQRVIRKDGTIPYFVQAIGISLFVATASLPGYGIAGQLNFSTVGFWRNYFLYYWYIPQIVAIGWLILAQLGCRRDILLRSGWFANITLMLAASTFNVILMDQIAPRLYSGTIAFPTPFFTPASWGLWMLAQFVVSGIMLPIVYGLVRIGWLRWGDETPESEPEADLSPSRRFSSVLGILLVVFAYLILMFVQVNGIAHYLYWDFKDAFQMFFVAQP